MLNLNKTWIQKQGDFFVESPIILLAAIICDDRFYLKPTEAVRLLLRTEELRPPYEGAKDYFYIADVDDCDYLSKLVIETCSNLPEPKPRRKK